MSKHPEHQPGSFVLRIWWEGEKNPLWRGWIQHAATGQVRYFHRLADLLAFVQERTGPLGNQDQPDGRSQEEC